MNRPLLAVFGVAAFFAGGLRADTATLVASRDNTLYESSTGSLSNGSGTYLFAGRTDVSSELRRGLLYFDLSSIPAGSNVEVRMQCSDGAGPGDLVECGIDDVSICDN